MSKDKTFQEKLKSMFRTKKDPIVNVQPNREFILTNEILHDLGKDSSTNTRVKTMKELTAHLSRLETNGVEKLWSCIQDMFLREYPNDVRHATFTFLQTIIKSQFDRIYVMRAQFFRFIKHHDNPQDIAPRVDLLAALTNDGKEVEHFEEEIGPFLLNWFSDVSRVGKLNEFLKILDNVIKFNSPHLDEYTMTGYVKHVCVLCCNTNQFPIVILCLQILGTVVAYSILPPESLSQFVGTLCRTVNIKCYCSASWKTMKNLLGTHLGHSTLYTMCRFLQEPNLKKDAGLLRGCVFYIHMALWDINSMQNLCCPPSSVLPSVLQAVKANHPSVALEVIIGIQKLINKQGLELLEPTWDIVLEIILHVIKQIELAPNEVPNNLTIITLHEILNTIENLIEVGNYKGSMNQFFAVIHECSRDRPETSVLKLIKFQSKSIRPTESAWLQNLYNLLANYFKPDLRTNVRLKVLSVLEDTIQLYGKVWQYEDELINHIVIPHMQNIATDDNIVVRSEVAKLLVDLCKDYNSNICVELLEILEKLLLRPMEKEAVPTHSTEADFLDISVLVPGLIQVFGRKIHKLPSSHATIIFKILVDFLEKNVHKPVKDLKPARIMIFECLLSLRADSNCRIGLPDPETKQLKFSPYLCASYKPVEPIVTSPPATSPPLTPVCKIVHLPMELAFQVILTHLEIEKDWEIVKSILEKLPEMLCNKAIMLTKTGNPQINQLVKVLCSMLQNKALNLVEGVNPKEKRLEFQTTVVNVLLALSCYGSNLDPPHQQLLINTLTRSTAIDPRCSRQSINSLTICMVDMRETMMKLLPEVLLRLSKISATIYIAMPILEFLSALSQLPTVFANFVGDQYMAVFAIALPYTNPFKYDNYIVSLAYHVISVWFLKCRLPFRKDFVKFIVSGLQTNVMVPFQELNQFKLCLTSMNQDSSDRKRSSSLTEQGSRRRTKPETSSKSSFIQKTPRDKTVLTFYEELNETCIDLMARYTYSPCSALPKRLPTAEFLLNGGITKSWMVGNKLITITTSGCTEKVLKHGVCDKCWSLCSSHNNSKIARYARSNSGNEEKESFLARQSSTDKGEEVKKYDAASLAKMIGEEKKEPPICACWCQGWAEVLIRRPTGNVSWVMKVQNQVSFKQHIYEFPLNEMSTLYMPDLYFEPSSAISIEEQEETEDVEEAACSSSSRPVSVPGSPTKQSLSRQSSQDSADDQGEIIYDDGTRARNQVRRSNSSPEMANWKNPFVHQKQERENDVENHDEESTKKNKKDVRVSCEAIPEEIAGMGTSPPTGQEAPKPPAEQPPPQPQHPSLLTCYSYPGSSPPGESNIAPKPYKTVPASPNQITSQTQPTFLPKNDPLDNNVLDRPNNLPSLSNLTPLSSKPPQSPTQTSPRLQRHFDKDGSPNIQKSSSSSKLEKNRAKSGGEPTLAEKRDRLHTISVMSTSTRKPTPPKKVPKEILKSGLNPSFVFLQLYHTACFGSTAEVPLYVPPTTVIDRAINILDRMYPYEVHKIGVLYINEGQVDKESDILRNTSGCIRYMEFLQNLGTLLKLADVNPRDIYLGGVDQGGADGKYMYTHQDDLVQLAFHVATLMPNRESDPYGNYKKAHVGNDNVVIIYNNSGQEFDVNTFRSQVTLAYIIVEPLDYGCNKVEVKVKSDLLKIIGSNEVISVSDQSVSILVRQLAIHADLAATVLNSLRSHATDPYASNWLERLRKLKNLREKVIQELKKVKESGNQKGPSEEKNTVEDFTDFT
ncbi:tuberin isoform X2 [Zophobas morio]|uniref:tuberin isoform X2 n=1 Tax=Zophobas morio TaxID=2755281 RepID=UPI003082E8F9